MAPSKKKNKPINALKQYKELADALDEPSIDVTIGHGSFEFGPSDWSSYILDEAVVSGPGKVYIKTFGK